MSERSAPSVFLCMPTFRRPDGLRKLLAHIEQLTYAGRVDIIVVDNDAEARAGDAVVKEIARSYRFPLTRHVEQRRGHTYAYDRAFVTACRVRGRPRTTSPCWTTTNIPIRTGSPKWSAWRRITTSTSSAARCFRCSTSPIIGSRKADFIRRQRYATGPVPMIYGTGNMLIRRATLEQYLDEPFLHEYAFTGGSDEEFFYRCRRDGRTFAWADEARVFETTPPSRTTVGYLLRRMFRNGTGATRVERKLPAAAIGVMRRWCKGLGLIGSGTLSLPIAASAAAPQSCAA